MMKALKFSALVSVALLAAGCARDGTLPRYEVSRDSLTYLRQSGARAVAVAPFTGRELQRPYVDTCFDRSALPSRTEVSYVDYIHDAFVRELRTAGVYSEAGGAVQLSGNIDRLSIVRTGPYEAAWRMQLTLRSSNGQSMTSSARYEFDTKGVLGPGLCENAARSLGRAVRTLIEKATTSPEFRTLVG